MKKVLFVTIMGSLLTMSINSCGKKDTPSTPSSSAPTINTPSDAVGAFASVKIVTTQTVGGITIPINIGTAVAWVGTSASFLDAGTITCNTKNLAKQTGNSYVFTPTTTEPTGLDFSSSPISWTVSGNSANNIAAYSHDVTGYFPEIEDIAHSGDVATNAPFTLTASGPVTGDSVIFVVAGPNASVVKTRGPNTSSCTFTAAEMGTLGTGSNAGIIQIAPYRISLDNSTGRNYYFIRETCVNKFVNLN